MIDVIVDFKALVGNNKLWVVDFTSRFVDLSRIFVDIAGEVVGKNLVVDTAEFFVGSSGRFVDIELEFVGNACKVVGKTRFVDRS